MKSSHTRHKSYKGFCARAGCMIYKQGNCQCKHCQPLTRTISQIKSTE